MTTTFSENPPRINTNSSVVANVNFPTQNAVSILTNGSSVLNDLFFHSTISPIWTIRAGGRIFEATKPLGARISFADNLVYAENDDLNLFGVGNSVEQAVEDLKTHIAHFIVEYASLRDDQVIGLGLKTKRLYESLFLISK